jgi:hypothetical protein
MVADHKRDRDEFDGGAVQFFDVHNLSPNFSLRNLSARQARLTRQSSNSPRWSGFSECASH